MKIKFNLPIMLILSIFILSACSNDKGSLDGSWKLIDEDDGEVEMYIQIEGVKGDTVYIYDREPAEELVYTILSAKDENRHLYAFEVDNHIEFNLEGYFQDKDNFIAESGYGEYFRMERIKEKEFRSDLDDLYMAKAAERKREERREAAYENEENEDNYDWDFNEEDDEWETSYWEENEEDEPEPTLSAEEDAFKSSCASCHGQELEGGAGPDLTTVGRHLNSKEIKRIIEDGQGAMPGGLLSGEEAGLVAEWLSRKH